MDDDAGPPKLALIHYDAATSSAARTAPPDLVVKLFNHKGVLDEYRSFKNNVLFLVANEDQVDRMVDVLQRYLAIGRIVGDADRMREFSEEQRKKLKNMEDSAELDVSAKESKALRELVHTVSLTSEAMWDQGYQLAREFLLPGDKDDFIDVEGVVKRLGVEVREVQLTDETVRGCLSPARSIGLGFS